MMCLLNKRLLMLCLISTFATCVSPIKYPNDINEDAGLFRVVDSLVGVDLGSGLNIDFTNEIASKELPLTNINNAEQSGVVEQLKSLIDTLQIKQEQQLQQVSDKIDVLTGKVDDINGLSTVDRLVGTLGQLIASLNTTLQMKQEQHLQQVSDKIEVLAGKVADIQGCACPHRRHGRVFHVAQGRYQLNFEQAKQKCIERDATIATLAQLTAAFYDGLDMCAAGWLSDGSVRYPITMPRPRCGGSKTPPGIRSWGYRPKSDTYNVYCFTREM